MLVDRGAADEVLRELELANRLEELAGGRDDLGADSVAGEQDDARAHAFLADMFSRT